MFKKKNIRVLHVGFGFRPWRGGGLIEYAEDLMEEQVKQGYEVYYFCSGRHYPFFRKSFLKSWKHKKGFVVYELINPPIYHGGDTGTIDDINSPICEYYFLKTLNEIKPDIIHIQELAGLPSSLIEIAKYYAPLIMTLHDYFLLCPTLKLFDFNFENCLDMDVGNKCVKCIGNVSMNKSKLIKNTIKYELKKLLPFNFSQNIKNFLRKVYKNFSFFLIYTKAKPDIMPSEELIKFFQARREKNIKRLSMIDLLIAQSYKVEQIYKYFLGEKSNIITIHLTVKHIELISPKNNEVNYPIKFATLNGFTSIPKGAYLLWETIKKVLSKGLQDKFELHIFGGIADEIKQEIKKYKNIFYHGPYKVEELDKILENINVGIVPSIWEEAYGYVGIEFLAKGIPVIGNNRGGIIDYVKEGFTGWINKTNSPEELAGIMENIIKQPKSIEILNKKILKNRDIIIKTIKQHTLEMHDIYKSLLAKRGKL